MPGSRSRVTAVLGHDVSYRPPDSPVEVFLVGLVEDVVDARDEVELLADVVVAAEVANREAGRVLFDYGGRAASGMRMVPSRSWVTTMRAATRFPSGGPCRGSWIRRPTVVSNGVMPGNGA